MERASGTLAPPTSPGHTGGMPVAARMWAVSAAAVLAISGCTAGPGRDSTAGPSGTPAAGTTALAWRRLDAAPSQRTEVTAAHAAGRIYLAGGYRADGATVSTVEILDVATGRWSTGPALPTAVNHAMAASVGDTAYVFGGYTGDGRPSAAASRLSSNGWQQVAALPEGRAAGTAVSLNGRVYVAGGIAPGPKLADRMLVYDPTADTWTTTAGPPTPREHLGGAGYGGRVYTVGGRTGAGNLAAFEAFDPASGTWARLADLPTRRGGLAATATCSGLVVAVGGEAARTFGEVEAYDVAKGAWRTLPPLPTPRHGLGVVAVATTVYVLSGGPKPGLYVADAAEALDTAPLGGCRA
jgi:serine/threonine-protein kinase PknK